MILRVKGKYCNHLMHPFTMLPTVSVIMPFFKQEHFLARAIRSLLEQTFTQWELILINDGSDGVIPVSVTVLLQNERIRLFEQADNMGLGSAFNSGINKARGKYIAYLPADDVFYEHHLQTLVNCLDKNQELLLAYTSIQHHYNKIANGIIDRWLQPVQVMHRRNELRWTERNELESDDLNKLFWNRFHIQQHIPELTCIWTEHPHQRHKLMQEPVGGINTFRSWYGIKQPLIFHSSKGNYINEETHYKKYRNAYNTGVTNNTKKLKILVVGELAYNPDRIMALAERGHTLYGLWMQEPYWYNYVGPLPFGQIIDIDNANWKEEVTAIKPDVIYALLNWQAVPMAHEVLKAGLNIPFVWHFKEGPFICMEKGTWKELTELYELSAANIFISTEMQDWFTSFLALKQPSLVIDGDLPKKEWFNTTPQPLLSEKDGAFHTVVPGRPIGLHPEDVRDLAEQQIHLHFYGDFTQGEWKEWIIRAMSMANGFLHIHPNVNQDKWVEEFSQYDAGWLHFFKSENNGELLRANWDDLNIPARLATLAVSGVPMLQYDNTGHIVASQQIVQKLDIGLLFTNMQQLKQQLNNKERMLQLRANLSAHKEQFTFDHYADQLIDLFYELIEKTMHEKSTGIVERNLLNARQETV